GDDSTGPAATNGWHPNLTFAPNQQFKYSNDSLLAGGSGSIRKRNSSTSIIQAQTTYQGELCYPVTGITYDTVTQQTTPEPPYWFRYDQASGKFYQYGIRQLINITQPGSWDLVGDFDAIRGSSYFIGDINFTAVVPGLGNVTFTGPLNGVIADSTTITTTGTPPQTIPCYKISMTATISGTGGITASIVLDYYLGYAAPTGIVELKLNPFSFFIGGTPVLPQPGFDRKLYTHTP
ncbi:MAG: hypothetical protein ACHQIH_00595, partial [Ignavibacteria bacterium]